MSIYQNLNALLDSDSRARAYFDKLPDYAKQSLRERARDIKSTVEMKRFIDAYLAGDA